VFVVADRPHLVAGEHGDAGQWLANGFREAGARRDVLPVLSVPVLDQCPAGTAVTPAADRPDVVLATGHGEQAARVDVRHLLPNLAVPAEGERLGGEVLEMREVERS